MKLRTDEEGNAMRILGIAGSLRAGSNNWWLLRHARTLLPDGVDCHLWEGLADIPPFNEDDEATPTRPVRALRAAIAGADGLLIATPEYNGSVPGQLKNALDWASRPTGEGALAGKPVAVIGASPSAYGAAWAQADVRAICGRVGARVLDREFALAAVHKAFDPAGRLVDPAATRELREMLCDLRAMTTPCQRDVSATLVSGAC